MSVHVCTVGTLIACSKNTLFLVECIHINSLVSIECIIYICQHIWYDGMKFWYLAWRFGWVEKVLIQPNNATPTFDSSFRCYKSPVAVIFCLPLCSKHQNLFRIIKCSLSMGHIITQIYIKISPTSRFSFDKVGITFKEGFVLVFLCFGCVCVCFKSDATQHIGYKLMILK